MASGSAKSRGASVFSSNQQEAGRYFADNEEKRRGIESSTMSPFHRLELNKKRREEASQSVFSSNPSRGAGRYFADGEKPLHQNLKGSCGQIID